MADTKITFDIEFNNKGFNKGFSSIEKQLDDMSNTLSKTSNGMSKIFDSSIQKNADRLTGKLSKQAYSINKVNNELKKMKEEYEKIASGDVVPQSLITLGSQSKRISRQMRGEAIQNDRLARDLALKREEIDNNDGIDIRLLESDKAMLEQNLEASTVRLNELTSKTKELHDEMMKVRMNPELSKEAVNLSSKIEDSKFKLSNLSSEANNTNSELKKVFGISNNSLLESFFRVKNSMSDLSKSSSKTSRSIIKGSEKARASVSRGLLSVGSLTDKTGSKMVTFAGRITRIAKAAFIFNTFRRGFASMRDYMGSLIKANDNLSNSLATLAFNLKVAFQPIWDFIVPSLMTLISWLNVAMEYIGRFTAMLFGSSYEGAKSSVKALEAQKKATEDVGKAATKAGKEVNKASKQLQGFDQLSKMAEQGSGASGVGGSAGGPALPEINEKDMNLKALERFKKVLDSIKKALEPTTKALQRLWENGLKPLGGFVWTALVDFYEKFLIPVGSWVLGEGFPRLVDAMTEQLAKVDWENLNGSVERLWDALTPFSILIGEGLLWFWEEVLTPLMGWALDDLLPVAIDLLTASLELLETVVEASIPTLEWLWEEFFKPFGEWAGKAIISLIEDLTKKLEAFSDWARENQETMDLVFSLIIGFFAGLIFYHSILKVVVAIQKITAAMKNFGVIAGILTSPVGMAAIAVGALAAAFIYIGSNWGKLNGAQRAETILGGLAAAAIAAGIAIAAFHASWTVGVAAATIVGSLAAIGIAYKSISSNAKTPSMSGGGTRAGGDGSSKPSVATSFFNTTKGAPPLPMLAKGGLIPPRKPRQVIVGDNMVEDEIVSPVSTMKKAVSEVLAESGGYNSNDALIIQLLTELIDLNKKGSSIIVDERVLGRTVLKSVRNARNSSGKALI